MKRFVAGVDREQSTLLPECLDDFIDESNPVRVIDAFVDALDLAELGFDGVEPAATGRPSYHPSILLKLYIYGYLNRVQSSRRLVPTSQCRVGRGGAFALPPPARSNGSCSFPASRFPVRTPLRRRRRIDSSSSSANRRLRGILDASAGSFASRTCPHFRHVLARSSSFGSIPQYGAFPLRTAFGVRPASSFHDDDPRPFALISFKSTAPRSDSWHASAGISLALISAPTAGWRSRCPRHDRGQPVQSREISALGTAPWMAGLAICFTMKG